MEVVSTRSVLSTKIGRSRGPYLRRVTARHRVPWSPSRDRNLWERRFNRSADGPRPPSSPFLAESGWTRSDVSDRTCTAEGTTGKRRRNGKTLKRRYDIPFPLPRKRVCRWVQVFEGEGKRGSPPRPAPSYPSREGTIILPSQGTQGSVLHAVPTPSGSSSVKVPLARLFVHVSDPTHETRGRTVPSQMSTHRRWDHNVSRKS